VPMSAPFEGILTNEAQVQVMWLALTTHNELRGAPITSYNMQWDQGLFGL